MLRGIIEETQALANKCCPLSGKLKHLMTSTETEDKQLRTRLEGFANLYMMIWTFLQLIIFVSILVAFYLSEDNIFMKDSDCCNLEKDGEYLTRTNNDLPLKACSNRACVFEDYEIFTGTRWLTDKRPRTPQDGALSHVFQYKQQIWCCNLGVEDEECCDKMPYGTACAAVMWAAGCSAVCAMLMAQVMLQGFYSFCSRRRAWFTIPAVLLGMFMRIILFCILFYFFFGFMFTFIFFWVPMMICDNPYACSWWEFGYLYPWYWITNTIWFSTYGASEWDGNMDFDSLITTHTSLAVLTDGVFTILYTVLNKIKDSKGQEYFNLTFFKL